ncbi:tRNA (adenosine(37)-N6)-threonylcarbamoyltransferase complex transferase subunit TsaD [Corynebacterium heidelbergense]|uniref:tRNA N6-adenosine threonylcarbamoyltransferase n=1 Tax=Corynebacterium heidelbergense TaxID=2055947 RepID=A0A364VB50_9CORY|nr:tRNA (adenosine(37)-N6)-threonylcarbamoyltransferase complex transferase subunit TsaD [Corynebacterium heidelbergense]RAV33880.1 multifunctional tRNA (adenosine(37)-N6)-threonylcarbamoyltransferase complex dimerization subunit type 1 TsaB/ribosomal protein alanine acetyltransferase/tRNA (adenosine(37)-N6)-threonylcarbamoyltransferase complex transferase subunit TsaD [Corynebacterium heidelbergense]WCZ37281.1 tRNA N6-adenosine threonylcarbamoyltransferase [Corynebacterium heidelbergense]
MLVLTVDTSTSRVVAGVVEVERPAAGAAVRVAEALRVRAQRVPVSPRGHMELLVPNILQVLEESQLTPGDLGAVVVGEGPGPFTGLRVGMATGAAFGDALGIPVHGVDSLAAMAASAVVAGRIGEGEPIVALSDARRREWYVGSYVFAQNRLRQIGAPAVLSPDEAVQEGVASTTAHSPGAEPFPEAEQAKSAGCALVCARATAESAADLVLGLEDRYSARLAEADAYPDPRGLVLAALSTLTVDVPEGSSSAAILAHGRDALRRPGQPLRARYLRRPDAAEPKPKVRSAAIDFAAADRPEPAPEQAPHAEATSPQLVALAPADSPALAAIEARLFPQDSPWSESMFRVELAAAHTQYWGLRNSSGALIGYAGIAAMGPADSPEFELHTIGLVPEEQGKGYSHLLMEALLDVADGANSPIFLEVRTDNVPAIGLYRRYGFTILGTRRNYYHPSGADAYTMRRAPRAVAARGRLIMGVESSCDETGVGIVALDPATGEVRECANVVASSMNEHARFGGVVPEIASRAHLEAMGPTMRAARRKIGNRRPDAVCATIGPGLAGALMVGAAAAKAYAAAWDVPFYAVNHLGGHVAVEALDKREVEEKAPRLDHAVALLVSGGHTQLLEVRGLGAPMRELGSTVDDAAGEAYDKVARLLGLGYPGGPVIDQLASRGNPTAIAFPRGMMRPQDSRYNFSFSGLKTAVARYVERAEKTGERIPIEDVCASFQEAVVDVLTAKALRACTDTGASVLLLGGGVSANRRLRELAAQRCAEAGVELRIPPAALCTDNGVMIAALGAQLIAAGARPSELQVGTDPMLDVSVPQLHCG